MYGPSDMYGDLSLEDVDEFEGLSSDDGREVNPGDRFQRNEFRSFDQDFEHEMEEAEMDAVDEQWGWDEVVDALDEDQQKLDDLRDFGDDEV